MVSYDVVEMIDDDLLVNSCTRSLNSVRSSAAGGTKPAGCFVEAARLKASLYSFGRARALQTWRMVFVNTLGTLADAMVASVSRTPKRRSRDTMKAVGDVARLPSALYCNRAEVWFLDDEQAPLLR